MRLRASVIFIDTQNPDIAIMLRIAIQAKGRLNEDCMGLLKDSGITTSGSSRKLVARAKGFPMDVLYLRDDDIPQAVAMGVADIGIVGLNEMEDSATAVYRLLSPRMPLMTDCSGLLASVLPHPIRVFLANSSQRRGLRQRYTR